MAKISSCLDVASVSPLWQFLDRQVFVLQTGVNTSVMSPGGFSGAASFTVLELRVQKCSTLTALTKARVGDVAESLLHVALAVPSSRLGLWASSPIRARARKRLPAVFLLPFFQCVKPW